MEISNSNLDITIAEVGVPHLVTPSINNIDYLAAKEEYQLTQSSKQQLNSLLTNLEFKPTDWGPWFNTIVTILDDSFNLGAIIADDPSQRECKPIQFHNESVANFNLRTQIFLSRRKKVFVIITNHILRESVKDERAKRICSDLMVSSDPVLLLEKLKSTNIGARTFEINRRTADFGSLNQGVEEDSTYIAKCRQLFAGMAQLGIQISNDWKIYQIIGGMSEHHSELIRELVALSPEDMEQITLENLQARMEGSSMTYRATNRKHPHGQVESVNYVKSHDKPWGWSSKEEHQEWSGTPKKKHFNKKRGSSFHGSSSNSKSGENPHKQNKSSKDKAGKPLGDTNKPFNLKEVECLFCGQKGHRQDACKEYLQMRDATRSRGTDPSGIVDSSP